MIPLLVLLGLGILTILGFIHAHSKRLAQEDHVSSNARVLAEFKRMSVYRPHYIINNHRSHHRE